MSLLRFSFTLLLGAGSVWAQHQSAANLGQAVRTAGLDASECYRIREVEFSQEEAQFFLTSGYLIFGKPVNGGPVTAVFSADEEGGDAEVLLLPPDRSERKSLASHTGTPNLDEHFSAAIFLFTDERLRGLLEQVRSSETARKMPEIGALLADRWNPTVANVTASFDSRMVLDLMTRQQGEKGFVDALIQGRKLGNFDLMFDPRAYEQLNAGQVETEKGQAHWDTWTSFATKSHRGLPPPDAEEKILSYRMDVTLDADLTLHSVTRIRVRATADSRNVIPFDITGQMIASSVRVDGVAAEVYQRESVRNGYVQNSGNELLLVVPAQPLEPGSEHEIEIVHQGKVIIDTGHEVFFVSSRGTWYPGRGSQFATYDVTYHYPRTLDLVAAGDVKEDRTDGEQRVTRRVTEGPIRVLGFNLGHYEHKSLKQNGLEIEVSANREVDDALRARFQPAPDRIADPASGIGLGARRPPIGAGPNPGLPQLVVAPVPPKPADELTHIATEMEAAMEFYRSRFGPPSMNHVEVSPVPGRFGQGYAGMIYLSTLAYLPVTARPLSAMPEYEQLFYGELLRAHETAHQWWGNVVSAGSYHHEWLMEALANYSALLFLESRKGPKFIDGVLQEYRRELLAKGPDGNIIEATGPVVQGTRLDTPDAPHAWTAIVYGKGTWIIHMLRRRMGDAQFLKMLAELRHRYEFKTINTDEFKALCVEFLPPKSPDPKLDDFFDQWVYGTGIPSLKLSYAVKGKPGALQLRGTITQSDADEDFSVAVPVEIQTPRARTVVKNVKTSNEPVEFSAPVAAAGAKAVLDPGLSVLRR